MNELAKNAVSLVKVGEDEAGQRLDNFLLARTHTDRQLRCVRAGFAARWWSVHKGIKGSQGDQSPSSAVAVRAADQIHGLRMR